MGAKGDAGAYVIALDVGTSTLRAYVYDAKATIVGASTEKVSVIIYVVLEIALWR